jgi:hypothetical protein
MNNGQLASRIVNGINALNKDQHISRRYIIGIAKQKAATYIAQKWADGSLFNEENLFTTIRCFEMEKADTVTCPAVRLRNCGILMRSRKTLPETPWSRYGAAILSVTGIDGSTLFHPSTLTLASLQKKRVFGHIRQYRYYVLDKYLYIPDVSIEAVNLVVLAVDKDEAECRQGCGAYDSCRSYWECDFVCPDKLREHVIQESINEIMITRMRIIPDENPNRDSNLKSATKNS